jgi:hypothetical protein
MSDTHARYLQLAQACIYEPLILYIEVGGAPGGSLT